MEEKNSNQETEVRSQENMGEQSAEGMALGVEGGQVNQAELTDQTNQVGEYGSEERGFKQEILGNPFYLTEVREKLIAGSGAKLNLPGKQVFSADLIMTAIRNTQHGVTFEVQNPEGFRITGLTHIQMDRKDFPIDDDFNLSFINAPFKEPKELVAKRKEFEKFTKMRLVILMEE